MISGVEDRAIIQAALTAGVNRFISKPAALEELESALTHLLGRVPNAA
jgi:DNA-binding NarL/FixJ family response regulator